MKYLFTDLTEYFDKPRVKGLFFSLLSDELLFHCFVYFLLLRTASVTFSYPADVLALRARGERLGADDGVPPHEGVLVVDVRVALLWSNHRAVVGRQQAVHTRLLVDLDKEYMAMKSCFNVC